MVFIHTMPTERVITESEFNYLVDKAVEVYRSPDCTQHSLQDIIKIGSAAFFKESTDSWRKRTARPLRGLAKESAMAPSALPSIEDGLLKSCLPLTKLFYQ